MISKKENVKNIFDSIAYRYDFLNHLLSFGIDKYWRRKALKLSGLNNDSIVLDVACGTGDFAIQAKKYDVRKIIGADFSLNMLKIFNQKSEWIKGNSVQMAAEFIPLKNYSVTNITVAFGVRNFYDIPKGFKSFYEVLSENGKATILEFRMPENKIFRMLYKFYFKKILPLIGGMISKNKAAYEYLPNSVEEFDEKINLKELLLSSGFSNVEIYPLTFGIVNVTIATK
jgi:demethylmenaquinone methyltransferase / 2-methoxy-6-polyprenyl-1,4-benzoquinol methylase